MKMIDRSGAVVDVPDDQVQEAYQSGKYAFRGGDMIPVVTKTGRVGQVSVDRIDDSMARGTRIATPEDIAQAKYGDEEVQAAGEGFARGLTGGLSDPLAIGVSRMLHGEAAAQKTRQNIASRREANQASSMVGEGAGMVLPFLVPGAGELDALNLAREGGDVLEAGHAATDIAKGAEAGAEALDTAGAVRHTGRLADTVRQGAQTIRESPTLLDAATIADRGAVPTNALKGGETVRDELLANEQLDKTIAEAGTQTSLPPWQASTSIEGKGAGTSTSLPDVLEPVEEAALAAESSPAKTSAIANAMGTAIRTAGAVPRGIAGAGELAERAIGKIIGTEASSVAGRAIQKIAAKAGSGAVEGALFGVGNEIDEQALGDEKLNGEKMLMAAEHGALLAGGSSAVLTGGGMLGREIIGRSSPFMRRLAGEQAWKAASPKKVLSERAMLRAGGTGAVGQAALEHGVFDGASNAEELLANNERALAKVGKQLGDEYAASTGGVRVHEVESIFDDPIKKFQGKPLAGNIVRALQNAKKEVIGYLVPEIADNVAVKHAAGPLSKEEMEALIKEHGPAVIGDKELQAKLGLESDAKGWLNRKNAVSTTPESIVAVGKDTVVPVQRLIDARQSIQDAVYRAVKANDPALPVQELRAVSHELAELENTAMDRAAREMGEGALKPELEKMRKDYQRLSLFKEALQNSNAKYATNRNLSLSDYLVAMGAMASGHAVAGALGSIGHKILRERGNAWAARALDKLAAIGAVERATSAIDREIDRGVASIVRPGARAEPKIRARVLTGKKDVASYEKRVEILAKATAYADNHADHVARVAATMDQHTPNIAKAFQSRALAVTAYLASKIPQGHLPTNTLMPQAEKPRVSDADKAKFNRAFDMANDPVGTTFSRMKNKTMTRSDAENLREMYPSAYQDMRARMIAALASTDTKLDFPTRVQIGVAFDIPADQAIEPAFVMQLQGTWQPANDNGGGKAPDTTQAVPKRELKKLAETTGLSPGLADIE